MRFWVRIQFPWTRSLSSGKIFSESKISGDISDSTRSIAPVLVKHGDVVYFNRFKVRISSRCGWCAFSNLDLIAFLSLQRYCQQVLNETVRTAKLTPVAARLQEVEGKVDQHVIPKEVSGFLLSAAVCLFISLQLLWKLFQPDSLTGWLQRGLDRRNNNYAIVSLLFDFWC